MGIATDHRAPPAPLSRAYLDCWSLAHVCYCVIDDMGDVSVGDRVDRFPAYAVDLDQAGRPEDAQVLGHQRLRQARRLDKCSHARIAVTEMAEESESRRRRERLKQLRCGLEGIGAHERHISVHECDEGPTRWWGPRHAALVSDTSSVLVVVVAVLRVLVVTVDAVDVIVVRHGLVTARRAVLVLGYGVLCVDFGVSHGGAFLIGLVSPAKQTHARMAMH